jgi:uncharacterized protein YqjF (DUF2071 family)
MRRDAKPFLSAEWRDLAMLNYLVPPDILLPFVPAGTELDSWQGAAYVSAVGFRFVSTRVLGLSIPGHIDFEEVNLRFYVRRQARDGWRRGVVFIRELVPRRAIAWIAKLRYNEPYRALPMRHTIDRRADSTPDRVRYEWRHSGQWEGLALRTKGAAQPLRPGSEAEFITEHYWGYTRQRDGSTIEYRVEHSPWRVWEAEDAQLSCDVAPLYGSQFEPLLRGAPQSAFLADGSCVVVFRPEKLE